MVMTPPVYRRVLGADFDCLPAAVRQLHDLSAPSIWRGRANVKAGTSLVAHLLARLFRLPPAGDDQPLEVRFAPRDDHEVWERRFSRRTFVSRQYPAGALILECVGPVTLLLRPEGSGTGITLQMIGARLFGIPLPSFCVPHIATHEFEADGRYRFDVSASLPLIGLLVSYAGWLERDP
jgi:hypothetical protein